MRMHGKEWKARKSQAKAGAKESHGTMAASLKHYREQGHIIDIAGTGATGPCQPSETREFGNFHESVNRCGSAKWHQCKLF